jgi:RNase adapter protein RapZ
MGALAELILISGASGAGKSTAMAAFEDAGFFCVDNLPPEMIRSLVEVFEHEGSSVARAAVVVDARTVGEDFGGLVEVLDDLEARGARHRLLFLDADEETLIDRFKETRRRHPLAGAGLVADGIVAERRALDPIRERADVVIDSSILKAHELRRRIAEELLDTRAPGPLAVTIESFGFKHGPARDADLVLDVRFLPNPHYVRDLRPLTGRDPRVVDYIARDGELEAFYAHLEPLLDWLLPRYVAEGKSHLLVAIGCTGGRHRSVAITEHLVARWRDREDAVVEARHRDADRFRKP